MCLTFWDSKSNMMIVRKQMAIEVGWTGYPAVCSHMMTGGKTEGWETQAYHMPIKDKEGRITTILA